MARTAPGDGNTAHLDTFVLDNLPPKALWPVMDFSAMAGGITYPDRLNCAAALLDQAVIDGHGERPVLRLGSSVWRYRDLRDRADRIARLLVETYGLVPGNRVLLRGANTPMLVACWFGIVKAGGVAVATMPMLRAAEIGQIIDRARPCLALCEAAAADELTAAANGSNGLETIALFTPLGDGSHDNADLDRSMNAVAPDFTAVDTAADDPVMVAFTSGTTGTPKGAVHFHRDLMAITDCFPRDVWRVEPDHVFTGTAPIAFTFGLGALILIPIRFGASSVLVASPSPDALLDAVARHGVTDLYTVPSMYRTLLNHLDRYDIAGLRRCNSAGEHLPIDTFQAWHKATGLAVVDQIGSTEMLHNFMSTPPDQIKPGATGRPVTGFVAKLIDDAGGPVAVGDIGWLCVQGPVGCLYLDNVARQRDYVRDGWNITGDLFRQDEDGYYWFAGRSDDMIVSSGYNIAAADVEQALLGHGDVAECAVIGSPDTDRGQVVHAFVVPRSGREPGDAFARTLQDHVKATIAPYKYPRRVSFLDDMPKTATGKIQRFRLRADAADSSQRKEPRMSKILHMTVNGRPRADVVADTMLLVDYLREVVRLTGTKMGCDGGECGACTIIVDGEPRLSCVTLAHACEGRSVETVEGLTVNGRPNPVQKAFHEKLGTQCGYCTPGMIMASEVLLRENPDPSINDIRDALAGNICRCTGYAKIIESVEQAAAEMRTEA